MDFWDSVTQYFSFIYYSVWYVNVIQTVTFLLTILLLILIIIEKRRRD